MNIPINFSPEERLKLFIQSRPDVIDTNTLIRFAVVFNSIFMNSMADLAEALRALPDGNEDTIVEVLSSLPEQIGQSLGLNFAAQMARPDINMKQYMDLTTSLDWFTQNFAVQTNEESETVIPNSRIALDRIIIYSFVAGYGFKDWADHFIKFVGSPMSPELQLPDLDQTADTPDSIPSQPAES